MAHSVSHSIARNEHFHRMNRSVNDIHANLVLSKESLRHQLAMAKYQARREIDLRIAQKERLEAKPIDTQVDTHFDDIERVRIIARRKKDHGVSACLLGIQFICLCTSIILLFSA